ncbi:MAG: hypothetical protein ACI4VQ_00005, partial [Clostridia bacterium]
IEELIRQREKNISLAGELRDVLNMVINKDEAWKEEVKGMSAEFSDDIIETLGVIGRAKSDRSQNYQDALKLINARIANLESNLHIEIDMERIEDRSKALSYIGIEVADALKLIPAPQEDIEEIMQEEITQVAEPVKEKSRAREKEQVKPQVQETFTEPTINDQYYEATRVEVKPSLWQRFKQCKLVRAIKYVMSIRIVLDVPALPSADENQNR